MPIKITKNHVYPIGLDIGASAVKMIQLRGGEESTEMLAAGAAQLPRMAKRPLDERLDAWGNAIRDILRTNAFKGRRCVLGMPAEFALIQHVKTPKLAKEDLRAALEVELQGKLPFAPENAVIRHLVAGDVLADGEPKQEIIAVAVSRDVVEAFLKMTVKAGLDVTAINIEACAVVECFGRLFRRASDAARTILYLDLGASTTQVVFSHGNQVVFARNLMTGGDQLDQAVAEGLKISADQARALRRDPKQTQQNSAAEDELYHLMDRPLGALGDELMQCLQYYESVFRNQSVERVIFVGGQAYDKRLCQALAQRLNLPAQVGDPLVRIKRIEGAGLDIGLDRREPQPDWAVAVGLSFGEAA